MELINNLQKPLPQGCDRSCLSHWILFNAKAMLWWVCHHDWQTWACFWGNLSSAEPRMAAFWLVVPGKECFTGVKSGAVLCSDILTSFVAFDNISYNLPFFVYAFKSRKVMFITCAELARWWTKGVANFRFIKNNLWILIISLKSQKRCHGSPPSTTAPPHACLTPSVTRSVWCSQTWGNLFHLWVIVHSIYKSFNLPMLIHN